MTVGEKIESLLKIEELESERNMRTLQKMKDLKGQVKEYKKQIETLQIELEKFTKKMSKYQNKLDDSKKSQVIYITNKF